mgnify:CR=1 FL=1
MIKNRKFSKFLLSIFLPVVVFLSIGFFSFGAISTALAAPEITKPSDALDNAGGAFYIDKNSTFTMTTGTISGFSGRTVGGGVYVADGGTFNMSGGSIYGNTAAFGGSQIYNIGTFTMTGGTIGKNGTTASRSGIYNTGKMNLYGGTIYEDISSHANISTKMACNIAGTITFWDNNATITLQDYAGTTPTYKIILTNSRSTGTIVTFKGSSTEPDVSKLSITGYDTSKYVVKTVKDSSGNWTVALLNNSVEFPSDWKTQVASSTYMTTTITPANLTSIKFAPTVPSGYTQIGTLSTGLPVYQGTTVTEIAFVYEKIYAPVSSSYLFSSLTNLLNIDLSAFNTSNVTNMNAMFYNCSSLTSLNVSNFNTSKVTNMSSMFNSCSALTSLDVSKFNTSQVTNMSGMFYSCSSLTSLDVSGFDTSKVTNMSSMFYNCKTLTSLDLSNFDTSKVTNMSSMFNTCTALTSLDVSGFNTSIVTNMSNMFGGCTALTSLDVSAFNTSIVTNLSSMFSSCSKLTSLDVSGFNTSKVTDMSYMFFGCSKLTSLDVSNFNTSNVTDMRYMFYNCSSLTNLDVSGFNTSNVTDMGYMFVKCSALTGIDLSNFNTSNVTNMNRMFLYCSALTSLDLSSFNMAKVTDMSNMLNFGTSNKIETLKTPYNNSSVIPITTGSTLYNEDTGAVVTTVPANTTKSLTYTNVSPFKTFPTTWKTEIASSTYMTSTVTVSNIQNIVFPTTLNGAYTKIGTLSTGIDVYKSVYNSGYIAFYSGKKIYMPANCTQLFYGLNVEKMSFESVDTTKTTNMSQMFANCTSMKILDLSTFNMANVSTVTNMLNFGTTGALGRILTPYGNKTAVAITASSTLYDTSTDSSATGVLANSTTSKTLAKKVTVTFNPYNGSAVYPSTYTKYYGERFGRSYPTTSRPDYTFEGWYTEISGGSSIDTYTLVGDTTFYAHWASSSSGGGTGGGGTTDPEPSLPSIFERRHETSQLDGETIGEGSVADLFDIFNSQLSNTFEATDVKIFSVVSPLNSNMDSEYEVLDSYGSSGGIEAVRLSNDGSRYGFLANEWIMGLYNNISNIGFDQWYYFDSMIFSKLGEMFPKLEILDLRGLDTSFTTFSFRIPDSVRIVIVPEDGCAATLVSNNYIQFIYGDGQTAQTNIYGGAYAAGSMGQITTTIDTIISDNIPENDMNGIYGFAIISTECPEQYNDYKFVNEYCQIENEVYLCLVEYTDSFIEKFGSSGGNIYLALVSYTSPIWITQRFVDYGGFTNFPGAGNMDYADFRGLSVTPNDYVHDMAQYLEVMSISQSLILPVRYADGGVNIETNSTIYNADGTVHTFLSTGSDENSGLEIARTKLYNVTAEDVDLYIDDKKWFDPRKNKIQIKTQNDGEE